MMRMSLLAAFICLVGASAPAAESFARGTATVAEKNDFGSIQRASQAGAALDSHLLNGGGTDDTAVLQRVLDRAKNGVAVELLIDGPALVSGLNVYGNTTIECTAGGGLYLKAGSSRAIIRNVHRSRDAIVDERITVRGCFLNGNRARQPSPIINGYPTNKEPDKSWIVGLQFHGVNDLTIENVTLWSIRSFGALIGNANRIAIRNVTVDHGAEPDVDMHYANTDGLHFKGPLRYLTINGVKLRTGDDALAFNADDWVTDDLTINNEDGPYVRSGPITDVAVNNVQLMDAVQAMRFSSSTQRIDRIVVNNVTGTLKGNWLATVTHFMGPSAGNIGSITFSNLNVDRSDQDAKISLELAARVRASRTTEGKWSRMYEEFNGGAFALFNINAQIENLTINGFSTRIADAKPIVRFGPFAQVKLMTANLTLHDPDLKGVPLELDAGSRIEHLNLAVGWLGRSPDESKNPIISYGGTIQQLNWTNTPPLYVGAELSQPNSVAVTFTQQVKAEDFLAGVSLEVNGRSASVSRAYRDPSRADRVHYVIRTPVRPNDVITWAYDAREGSIRNWSGDSLLPVAKKTVR